MWKKVMQLPMGKYASMSMYMCIYPDSTQNRQSCRRASSKIVLCINIKSSTGPAEGPLVGALMKNHLLRS
jgi:hypothetical protein